MSKEPKKIVQIPFFNTLIRIIRLPLFFTILGSLSNGFLLVFQLWLLSYILNGIVINNNAPKSQLIFITIEIVLLISLRGTILYLIEQVSKSNSEKIKCFLRQILFSHLLNQGPKWTRMQSSGELASGLIEQIEALDGFFSKYLSVMMNAAIFPILLVVLLMCLDISIGLIILITMPLIPIFMILIGKGAQIVNIRYLSAFSRLSGIFSDRLRGLTTLKLYGQTKSELEYISNASETLRENAMSVLRIAFLSSAVLEFFSTLGIAGVAVYIALNYLGFLNIFREKPFDFQIGLFCLIIAPEVYMPLRRFAMHYHDRAAAYAAAEQIKFLFSGIPDLNNLDYLKKQKNTNILPNNHNQSCNTIAISVTNLNLYSKNCQVPLLKNAKFEIPAGRHIALLGNSGIGKTLLLETLVRLKKIHGQIKLNGLPILDWEENSLRNYVHLISQRPYLFADSISNNIRLARPNATNEHIYEAARRAQILEFTQKLPLGLNTILGKGGYGISAGQAQRVAIARLFLCNPGLILMDEPTAHLDSITQLRVINEILDFSRNRSILLVTHSIEVANKLPITWYFKEGRIETS